MITQELLRRCPLFSLLTPRQWAVLVPAAKEATFKTGATIFQEDSAGLWAYLVLEGRVRAVRSTKDREIALGFFGPGEVFGEYALLEPFRNTCTCRATCQTRLLRVALPPLRAIFTAMPGVGPKLKDWLRLQGLVCYLRDQSYLGFMTASTSLSYLDHLQPAVYRAEHTIQADGLADDHWFFIESGRVRLHFVDKEEVAQPPVELGAGDCFGAQALLGRGSVPVAVAVNEIRCQALSREAFAWRCHGPTPSLQSYMPQPQTRGKYAWVGQREEADCGVAALAMVARFHGHEVDLDHLRALVPVRPEGASVTDLRLAGTALGLRCLSVCVELERLNQVTLPAIAHLRRGHYVVIYEAGPTGVVIGDPATSIVRISLTSFAEDCSGNLLLVHPPKL